MSADARGAALDALGGAAASTPTFDDVFSLRKPKDLGAGLSSAGQSAVKGVLLGAGALVSAPIMGARADGAKGFAKGLGLGLASAVVLPVVGGAVAATQVVRGAVNTPEAVQSASRGKRYDSRTRRWVAEDLERDGAWLGTTTDEAIFARAEARAEARGTKAGIGGLLDEASRVGADESGRGRPAETEYYDCLEVAPSATSGEIRRQYYVLARKCHPDKNLDDPDAKAKFQKIGEAYQILSDEKLRAQYDARGKEGMEDVPVVNPAAFFGVLFGSEQMENFIGRLKLATLAMAGTDLTREEQDLLQRRRETRLAIKLASMLDVYVDWQPPRGSAIGKKERANAFVEMMKPIAETLVNASFGTVMLKKIGWVYKLEAEKYLHDPLAGTGTWLDLGLRSTGVTMQQKSSTLKNKFAALKAGINVVREVQSTEHDIAGATSEQHATELRAKQQQDILPHVIDALWSTSAVDIESTLRHACSKTLHDASASRPRRAARAKALHLLGDTFSRVAPETNARDHGDVQVLIENALRAAFEPQR